MYFAENTVFIGVLSNRQCSHAG